MTSSPHNVKDSLLEGCSTEQRTKGKMPTPSENTRFLEPILQRLEKKQAEAKPKAAPDKKPQDKAQRRTLEAQRRAERAGFQIQGSWELMDNVPLVAGGSPLEVTKDDPLKKLLRHRLRLIQSKPDWREKYRRINPYALQGYLGPEKQKHAVFLVRELIRKSNEIFGDWWKSKPKKLWSYKGQAKRG